MRVAFYGSSLLSAYWNGAATYYRGILKALAGAGHRITFFEPDAYGRQQHRDIEPPDWAEVVVYPATDDGVARAFAQGRDADLVVKANGVGVYDSWLEEAVASLTSERTATVFWDVDAPATLEGMNSGRNDALKALVPEFTIVLTYGGGPDVVAEYAALGARRCVPIYNALDPDTHHPVPAEARFAGDLAFLGNRLPDREARVEEFFLKPAAMLPERRFLIGGNGWHDKAMPANVRDLGHVYTADHNALNCSATCVLNINRDSMARVGFSPPTRIFEAAGAGACILSDAWQGMEQFFEPGREILLAKDGAEVAGILGGLTGERARAIGEAALRRVLGEHTYAHRAVQLEAILEGLDAKGVLS